MAGKMNTKMSVAVACLVALLQISSSFAASHQVGGSGGWTNSGSDYSSWASGETFAVGDTLVFDFTTNTHSVTEVTSKSDYDNCGTGSQVSTTTTGPATIKLTTAGAHYYICTFHCIGQNQKLAITVGSSSTSTPTASPPSSSSTPSTPSTTNTTSSPPPPPGSSAVVARAGLVMPFLMGAAAFLM